ncbi:hypothetical protein [Veronia pacifica]|nr:hypothetical protein [Veronia pacifica]
MSLKYRCKQKQWLLACGPHTSVIDRKHAERYFNALRKHHKERHQCPSA